MASHIPDEKKIKAVQEAEAGTKTARQICVEYGIQSTQFKGWKIKFGSPVLATTEDKGAQALLPSRVNELLEEVKQPDRVPKPSAPHIPYPPVRKNKEAIRREPGRRYRRFSRPTALPDLEAFKGGSTRATYDFYDYLKPRILYHLKDLFPDIMEMTSYFDDIFLVIWEKRMTFQTTKELISRAYLSATFLHSKFNDDRKRKPENGYSLDDLLGCNAEPADEPYREKAEESEYFHYLIHCLPYPYKDVLLMNLEEWTPEERKASVDVVPAIEKTYYQYGIRLLRKHFGVKKLPQQVQSHFENWRRQF